MMMRHDIFPLAFACLLFLVSPAPAHTLYALSAQSNTLHTIKLNPETGQSATNRVAPIHPLPSGAELSELVALADGHAYTLDRHNNRLIGFRLQDGAVIATTQLDQNIFISRRGLDIAPDGLLYGILPGMELRTINPFSGQTMFVAPITGADVIEAIAFSPAGTLYAVGNPSGRASRYLYTIDIQTGRARHIAQLPVPDIDTLTWAGGHLYAADSHGRAADLYRIDPESGHLTNLGSTGITELNGMGAVRSAPD